MLLLLSLARLACVLLILATAVPAILAIFGSLVPFLDLINHLQLVLFFATLIATIIAILLGLPNDWKIFAAMGFAFSAWTFMPEWLSSFEARPPETDAQVIKVMTHNIFGLNYDMDRVAKVIAEENPDIVALQEYFPEQAGLDALLKPNYPYRVVCRGGKRANIGLYSKLPFDREMRDADCPDNAYGTQRTAHIIVGFTLSDGTHFSLMTTHMDWPFPIERQRAEYLSTERAVKAVQGPLLLVGDFNSTPWSYVMKAFEAESGLKRETRNLITYPELFTVPGGLIHTWPFLALDQVFERGVAVHELHRGPETGSDHLPVIFSFSVPRG